MWTSFGLIVVAIGLWRRTTVSRAAAAVLTTFVLADLLLLVAWGIIDRLSGSGIDASVIYHLQMGFEGTAPGMVWGVAATAVALTLASLAVAAVAYRQVRAAPRAGYRGARLLGGVAFMAGAVWFNPAVADLVRLSASIRQTDIQVPGQPPPQFVPVTEATFSGQPRNFILLYLESLERSYLDETRFPGLMPNLKALETQAISFTDITEVSEASWTMAGMVASQCGMPLVGGGAGFDEFLPGASCLGDLLDAQDFDLTYLGGADLAFGGKGTLYQSHGFDRILGRTELQPLLQDPDYVNGWGLFDDSLYAEATRHLDDLAGLDRPFGLVMLTLDTHHPFGFLSQTCADQPYEDGANEFLNAAHCADRLAGTFIRQVLESPDFKDTVLIVASDHMAMPNLAQDRLEAGERRNLLMVFAPDQPPAMIAKPGSTLDIGPTLLGLIGAPTPALGFGRDLLASPPTLRMGEPGLEPLIDAGRGYLAALWSYPKVADGMVPDLEVGEVALGSRTMKLPALFQLNDKQEVTAISFELGSDVTLPEVLAGLTDDQRFIWLDICVRTAIFTLAPPPPDTEFCALLGSLGSGDLYQIGLQSGVALPAETLAAALAPVPQGVVHGETRLSDIERSRKFVTANVIDYTPPNGLTGEIAIRSAGYLTGSSWAMNAAQGDRVDLMRGLTLLGLNPDAAPVKIGHVDTCGYGGRQPNRVPLQTGFQAAMDANAGLFGAFAIVAHNSVVCYEVDPGLEPLFAGTGLTKWRDLWYEEPYVAVIAGNGETQEFVGARQTAMGVDLRNIIRPVRQNRQRNLPWLPRIAHAGGALDGQTYTNALEALDANATAFDLIEIDLAWTSDDQLVCLHDWDQGFLAVDGSMPTEPLTLAEFQRRAAEQAGFRPCTLATLVDWLRSHDGARIVLDLKTGAVDAYRRIAETHPDLRPRLVPQVYVPEDYLKVRDMGYDDVIWSLYQFDGDDEAVLAWLPRMDLLGLTMPVERLPTGLARRARQATGVLTWVHTVNTLAEFDAALRDGAAEVFTDRLLPTPVTRFEVISSGDDAGLSLLRPLDGEHQLTLTRGVSLVALMPDDGPALLATFDGCEALDSGVPPDPGAFHSALMAAVARGQTLAVVIHDSAFCEGVSLAPLFAGSPLTIAPTVRFRQPYIGLVRADGRVLEFTGTAEGRLREILAVEDAP